LWTAAWFTFSCGFAWASLLIAIPAAGFLLRLFMIQHDCGHGTFFANPMANDWVGRVLGVLTLTPYDCWRRTHAIHHATTANLDRRGIGDVDTLTVREYWARSWWGRFKYRLYRHPLIMFGIGPAYLFLLQHRIPVGLMVWRLESTAQQWLIRCSKQKRIDRNLGPSALVKSVRIRPDIKEYATASTLITLATLLFRGRTFKLQPFD
jgi:fumarate reductase subunit D